MVEILGHKAVRHHGVKLDQHIQDPVFSPDVGQGPADPRVGRLPDLDRPVFQGHLAELLQIIVEIGTVLVIGQAVDGRDKGEAVRKVPDLGNEVDHILPEAIHPHVQPEAHDVLYLLPDSGIVHIEIRLPPGKNMQVILAALLIVLPGQALKLAEPVIGGTMPAPPAARQDGVPPDIIVAVGVVPALAGFDKPGMLVRRVVDHQVQQDLEAQLMGPVQDLFELIQGPVVRVDIFIVGNIIAVIRIGRWIDGAEPDGVHPQGFYVVQLVINPVEVSDPVAVAVAKAPDPDLIK